MSDFVTVIFWLYLLRVVVSLWGLSCNDRQLTVEYSRVDLVIGLAIQLAIAIWAGFLVWSAA
jgi:hypothetical protein